MSVLIWSVYPYILFVGFYLEFPVLWKNSTCPYVFYCIAIIWFFVFFIRMDIEGFNTEVEPEHNRWLNFLPWCCSLNIFQEKGICWYHAGIHILHTYWHIVNIPRAEVSVTLFPGLIISIIFQDLCPHLSCQSIFFRSLLILSKKNLEIG